MARLPLDKLLVKRQLASDLDEAAELIRGKQVVVQGIINEKPKSQVDAGVDIKLRTTETGYVSRGAHKLLRAIEAFSIDVEGCIAMDVGASTGGFSDVLLKQGAAKVYAIDVGYGQLAWSLRQDARVVVLERENVRKLDPQKIPDEVDLAVIDVSFISLTKVLLDVARLMKTPRAKIAALIKPQFEAEREEIAAGGVVRDEDTRQRCIDRVLAFAQAHDFVASEVVESPIRGPAGNVEYLVLLQTPREPPTLAEETP